MHGFLFNQHFYQRHFWWRRPCLTLPPFLILKNWLFHEILCSLTRILYQCQNRFAFFHVVTTVHQLRFDRRPSTLLRTGAPLLHEKRSRIVTTDPFRCLRLLFIIRNGSNFGRSNTPFDMLLVLFLQICNRWRRGRIFPLLMFLLQTLEHPFAGRT